MRRRGSPGWVVVLLLVVGVLVTVAGSVSIVTAFAYRSASPCPSASPARSADCLTTVSVRVAGVSYEWTKGGGNRIVSFDPHSGLPTTYFDAHILGGVDVQAGDEVQAQLWRGKVTMISLNGRSYDSYNTQADSWIGLIAGLGLMLMAVWMWRLERRLRRAEPAVAPARIDGPRAPASPALSWWSRHASALGGFGTVVLIGVITAILMATGHG